MKVSSDVLEERQGSEKVVLNWQKGIEAKDDYRKLFQRDCIREQIDSWLGVDGFTITCSL